MLLPHRKQTSLLLLILFVCQLLRSLDTSPSVSHPDSHSTTNCPPGFKGSHTGTLVSMVTKEPCNLTKDFTVVSLLLCKHTKSVLLYGPFLPAEDRTPRRALYFWGLWVIRPCEHQVFFFLTGPLDFQILVELVE